MSRRANLRQRAAVAIYSQLRSADPEPPPTVSVSHCQACLRLTRLIEHADRRGLHAAARRLRSQLAVTGRSLAVALQALDRAVVWNATPAPSIREVLAELDALAGEFGDVTISRERHTVSVLTDRVVLDGVDLGPFEIVLHWPELPSTSALEVIAVEEHAAATDDDTTHPHVQCHTLCLGEGKAAVRKALQAGRLFDGCVLVRQILHTYSPASAYITLDNWFGIECPECGATIAREAGVLCEGCSTEICGDCSTRCSDCEYRYCADCIRTCTGCESDTCVSCRAACRDCGDYFCKGCLPDDDCCLLCHDKQATPTTPEPACDAPAPV
jgi:hypothetical protein